MATTQSFESAWEAYQQAAVDLYKKPAVSESAERGEGEIYREQLEERSEILLTRSGELRESLLPAVKTEELDQRELATLKLFASAAHDLSTAIDLMELENAESDTDVERGMSGQLVILEKLREVMNAPLEGGMASILDVERTALPHDPQAARKVLQSTINELLGYIPQGTAEISKIALKDGLFTFALDSIPDAETIQQIMEKIPEGISEFLRRAAEFIIEAFRKFEKAIGKEQLEFILEQLGSWLDELWEKTELVDKWLNELYETERLGDETRGLVEASPVDTEFRVYNQATSSLEQLQARYAMHQKVLKSLLQIVKIVKRPLLGVGPWGLTAVYGSYAAILSYAIYGGGDYLDWYRLEEAQWLDRVPGLRTTMRKSLTVAG